MKATILIQSTNKSTYAQVLRELLMLNVGINEICWIFIDGQIKRDLTPTDSRIISESHVSINSIIEIKNYLNDFTIIDVSGLSKESLIKVFAQVVGKKSIQLYTLSQNAQRAYVDLTAEESINVFRNKLLLHKNIVGIIQLIILVGVASIAVLWLVGFDSSSPFIAWLGIFIGLLGIALSLSKL